MVWRSIKNTGKVKEFHKAIPGGDGKIKIGEFLGDVLDQFARVSTSLYDNIGDHLFAYSERQLSAIFLPAFYSMGLGAMQEAPTRRGDLDKSSHAWLDYWVESNGNRVYLIEVKHHWYMLGGKYQKEADEKNQAAIQQLERISQEEVDYLSCVNSTHKISMMVMPVYRNILHSETECDEDGTEVEPEPITTDDFEEHVSDVVNEVSGSMSWVGGWLLPERMQESFESTKIDGYRAFPGVILMAKVVN